MSYPQTETPDIELTWVRVVIKDFISSPDVQQMDTHEFGAFVLLLMTSFLEKKRGYLRNDDEYLRKITRLKRKQWESCRDFILSKFKEDEETKLLYNERWLQEIRLAEGTIVSNKKRTEAARESRSSVKKTGQSQDLYYHKNSSQSIPLSEIKPTDTKEFMEYIEEREKVFMSLEEDFRHVLKVKVGIDKPVCWANRRVPQGYFDLVDCIIRVRDNVEWRTSAMRNNNLSKDAFLSYFYEFVKEIKDATVYMSYHGYDGSDGSDNFISHFLRWLKSKVKNSRQPVNR